MIVPYSRPGRLPDRQLLLGGNYPQPIEGQIFGKLTALIF